MKKTICIIAIMFVCLASFSITTLAVESRLINISKVNALIYKSGYYTCTVSTFDSGAITSVHMTLYEKNSSTYTKVANMSDTKSGSACLFESYYAVKPGSTYKLSVVVTVTINGVSETVTSTTETTI